MKTVKIYEGQTSPLIKLFNLFCPRPRLKTSSYLARFDKEATKYQIDEKILSQSRKSLEILVDDLIEHNDLSFFGRYFAAAILKQSIANFFSIYKFSNHFELDLKVDPIIILGLPRTGSTLFFDLMSADKNLNTLNFWQARNFSPAMPDFFKKLKGFIQYHLTQMFSPQLKPIHHIKFNRAGECTQILTNSLHSISFACYFHLPNYSKHVLNTPGDLNYLIHKNQLALLNNKKQWLLKSPMHHFSIPAILKTYPHAKIIHLHRDTKEVIGSTCSLIAASRNLFSINHKFKVTGAEILKGIQWAKKQSGSLDQLDSKQLVNINYKEFIKNPTQELKKIYQKLNLEWSDRLELEIQNEFKISKKDKFGKHIYDINDYGLTLEQINASAI